MTSIAVSVSQSAKHFWTHILAVPRRIHATVVVVVVVILQVEIS
jgi:hypothetical protein